MEITITLDRGSPEIEYLCKKDKRLAKVISMVGPLTYKVHDDDPYDFLVHEIIEQMLSIKAAAKIYSRLSALCDEIICPNTINKLTDEQIRGTGISASKVSYIREMTNEIISGQLSLSSLQEMSDKDIIKRLTKIRGIGFWTAKMYLIFVLNRPDVLPLEDGAFLQSYRWLYNTDDVSKQSIEKKCHKWKPYSSIASRFMYRALDMGFTKKHFHLYK